MWVGAALTKPGRARTARWCGSGERDGKEYERNPRYYVLKYLPAQSGGSGPGAVHNPPSGHLAGWEQLLGGYGCARREAMVKVHGVTMARPQGQSGAPHPSSEQQ